jgi:hypothetical protein
LKTNQIRNIQPGDTWNYSGTGTFSNGTTTINLTGTATAQILSSTKLDPITSTQCFDQFTTEDMTGPSGTHVVVSVHDYLVQDSNGTIYTSGVDFGIGLGDTWVTAASGGTFLSNQSPMSVGQNYGTSVTYTDGTTETISASVIGIEDVQTNIGNLESYKVSVDATINSSNGTRTVENNTIWYVPGLGSIKLVSNSTSYSGSVFQGSLSITATLTSTSVAY